jgi:hypothetical protein
LAKKNSTSLIMNLTHSIRIIPIIIYFLDKRFSIK